MHVSDDALVSLVFTLSDLLSFSAQRDLEMEIVFGARRVLRSVTFWVLVEIGNIRVVDNSCVKQIWDNG